MYGRNTYMCSLNNTPPTPQLRGPKARTFPEKSKPHWDAPSQFLLKLSASGPILSVEPPQISRITVSPQSCPCFLSLSLAWSSNSLAFVCWPPPSSVFFKREWRLLFLWRIYSHELSLSYYFCISLFFMETNISTRSNNLVFIKFYQDKKRLCGF